MCCVFGCVLAPADLEGLRGAALERDPFRVFKDSFPRPILTRLCLPSLPLSLSLSLSPLSLSLSFSLSLSLSRSLSLSLFLSSSLPLFLSSSLPLSSLSSLSLSISRPLFPCLSLSLSVSSLSASLSHSLSPSSSMNDKGHFRASYLVYLSVSEGLGQIEVLGALLLGPLAACIYPSLRHAAASFLDQGDEGCIRYSNVADSLQKEPSPPSVQARNGYHLSNWRFCSRPEHFLGPKRAIFGDFARQK